MRHDHISTNIPGFVTATEMPIAGWSEADYRKAIEYTDFPLPEIALPCRRLFWSHIQHPIALSSMYNAPRPRWHRDGAKRSGRGGG
jgi:hypothetical protein